MKGRPIDELVYEQMFPRPRPSDPQSFSTVLSCGIIPEVRRETRMFYGHLSTQEAMYPGLDYNHATHRMRLTRWYWHRRMFRAFDALRLTHSEIARLTQWEGTKWAKEKFEEEEGIVIRDTTADDLDDGRSDDEETNLNDFDDDDDDFAPDDAPFDTSLFRARARPPFGDMHEDEWEYWIKQAIESGDLAVITGRTDDPVFRRFASGATMPAALIPSDVVTRARAGVWDGVPVFLRPLLHHALHGQDPHRSRDVASGRSGDARELHHPAARVSFSFNRSQNAQPE